MIRHPTNVRQAVRSLDDLARPSVAQGTLRNLCKQRALQMLVTGRRFRQLTGLVVLAAEDYDVVIAVTIDSQVTIRLFRIPEERVGDPVNRYAPGNDVA